MNPHIIFVIDHQLNPEKYTKEQLEENAKAANTVWDDAETGSTTIYAANAAADADAKAAYWLNEYFNITGENKQDYIDAINKDNKQ